jgi:hypothetical protein
VAENLESSKLYPSRYTYSSLNRIKPYMPLERAGFTNHSRIPKHDNRISLFGRDICHLCCLFLTSALLVLGSQVLDKLDVLLLGVGRAQVLELGPLVVLRLALRARKSAAAIAVVPYALEGRNVP